jgi:hypothetical protein
MGGGIAQASLEKAPKVVFFVPVAACCLRVVLLSAYENCPRQRIAAPGCGVFVDGKLFGTAITGGRGTETLNEPDVKYCWSNGRRR